jgi:hypothetical protein
MGVGILEETRVETLIAYVGRTIQNLAVYVEVGVARFWWVTRVEVLT